VPTIKYDQQMKDVDTELLTPTDPTAVMEDPNSDDDDEVKEALNRRMALVRSLEFDGADD
jgi:hypothetical protein